MKQDWTIDEIIDHFTLLEDEQEPVKVDAPHNKLGQALLLKFFQYEARFPENQSEIPLQAVDSTGTSGCRSPCERSSAT
jgi:hypothetical protein